MPILFISELWHLKQCLAAIGTKIFMEGGKEERKEGRKEGKE
jgi:hypothetical protein